jgi:hypothetical protein
MSAFVRGLESGQRMAQGWLDTYETARRRREAEELKRRREEIMGAQPEDLGLRYSPEQAEQLRLAAESGQYDIGYGDGGYQVTPTADPRQTGLVAPEQQVSRFMGQEVEGQMTPQQVAQMREQALVDTIADPMERQRAMQGLRQGRLTDMQIEEFERAATLRQNTERAQQALSQRIASGEVLDVPTIFSIANETGADPQALIRSAADFYDITEKQANSVTNKLVRDINAASRSPEQFNELLRNFDPNPDDNIVPELRIGRDGSHQVFYGDQPMSPAFKPTEGVPAMTLLAGYYRDQVKGDPFATAVQLATLEAKNAQTQESRARTAGLAQEKLSPLEKTLGTLQRLGIPVTDAQIKSLAGIGAADLSPQRAALQKVYLEQAKQLPPGDSRAGQALAAAITQLYTDQATETRSAEVVESVSAAHKQGRGADALAMLRRQGFAEPSVKSIADRAGVPYTPPPAGATPAEADTPTQPGLARQPVQLLSPLYRAQDWARRQNEINAQQFDPGFNPYGGGLR